MTTILETGSKGHRNDIINLIILVSVTSLLGVYLIVTAVLISKDGVFYIERAQEFSSNPARIVREHPPGYPFLIFINHKFVSLFGKSTSLVGWIYSAQGVNLLCRVLALVPLYFTGKLLVSSRNSFWALLILILLPYPAEYGSDVLRDWPYILFLAAGFLFLLWGAEQGRWWMFGLVGLAGGLGHIVRPECAQLVLYGFLWLLVGLFLTRRNMNRLKLVCAIFILLFGFAVPTAPYLKSRGRILPPKLYQLISSSDRLKTEENQDSKVDCRDNVYTAESIHLNVVKAIGELFEEISNNLMHFFMLPLLLGIYLRFRKKSVATNVERFFIPVFIVFNVMMTVLLYSNWKYLSRRHCLPLVVFTVFYIPVGLRTLGDWLAVKIPKGWLENNRKPQLWFFILIITGLAICTPKLLRPIHVDKKAYKEAAKWLKQNTRENDLIAVFDKRIGFYAERKRLEYEQNIPREAQYIVTTAKSGDEKLDADKDLRKELSFWIDRKKTKQIMIYKVL
jgi:hypothetical protein